MGMLTQFWGIPQSFGMGQEDEIEEITLRPKIWWHDVIYN